MLEFVIAIVLFVVLMGIYINVKTRKIIKRTIAKGAIHHENWVSSNLPELSEKQIANLKRLDS